jgi:hypothetical protein
VANHAVGIDRQIRYLRAATREELAGLKNRGMLDRAGDHMSRPSAGAYRADQGEVIGLGAAGGEDDFVGLGTDQRRNLCSGAVDRGACDSAFLMQTRRIAIGSAQVRPHRVEHAGIERGCGGMIKINAR